MLFHAGICGMHEVDMPKSLSLNFFPQSEFLPESSSSNNNMHAGNVLKSLSLNFFPQSKFLQKVQVRIITCMQEMCQKV